MSSKYGEGDYKGTLKTLIGRIVRDVLVTDDESGLRFVFDDGLSIDYRCVGDCCSETWIAEALNLSALVGHHVQNVVDLELPNKATDGNTRQEFDEVYGYRLDTVAGSCTLVFRNSSNGYYGGWIEAGSFDNKTHFRSILSSDDWTAYEKEETST